MTKFFRGLADKVLTTDGQIANLTITKVGEELTVHIFGIKGKKDFTATGTPEELDADLLDEIIKTPEKKAGLKTTIIEEEEEEKENIKPNTKKDKVETKAAPKKPVSKKGRKTKVEEEKVDSNHAKELEEALQPEEINEPVFEKDVTLDFKQLMKQGKELFADRKYQGALDIFEKAKELKPGDAEAIMEATKAEKWVKAVSEL